MRRKIICCGFVIIAFLLIFPLKQTVEKNATYINNGDILYVGGSGPNNFTSIQDAINAAEDGATIFVYDDSSPYYENIIVDKTINLIGENTETTIINGNGNDTAIIIVKSDYVNISGFTITSNKGDKAFTGILLGHGLSYSHVHDIKIMRCNFFNFVDAIGCCGPSFNITISNCKFWDSGRAIVTGEKNNYVISNCDIKAWGGIAISGSTTVLNCTFHPGKIWIHDADNNILLNNYIFDGAIQIEYSSYNILKNNVLQNSSLEIIGHDLRDFYHDIDTSNTMQGKPIYYLYNEKNIVFDENNNIGYLILALCENITVRNLELYGAVLAFSHNNYFENCSFYGNSMGVYFHNSTYNSIHKCYFENYYPLLMEQSSRNNISYCAFSDFCLHNIEIWHSSNENIIMGCTLNGNGIYLGNAHNNTISGCIILNAECGIEIDGDNNLISFCNISDNKMGIFVNGYYNKIYSNNFIDNDVNAFCYGWNIWNIKDGGNYWDNYYGFDLNKDGIGELPYHIRTDIQAIPSYMESFFNFDWRPLMHPVKTCEKI